MRLQTRAIHGGVDKDTTYNSVITPIYQTSTFRFTDIGVTAGYDYTRAGNPTRRALEENLTALEGGAGAIATATGMSAITTTLHLFWTGDHIICTHDCYGGTYRLFRLYEERFGLRLSFVDLNDVAALRAAFRPETKAVWIETPSNPLLRILDIQAIAQTAHEHGALAITDNTFLSPASQRPFELGADIIIHSTTKYLNGHSDVVGGAVIAKENNVVEQLQHLTNVLGQGASPFDCWLILRGVKTLAPRMRLHEKNAAAVARFLSEHPAVDRVYYPGLTTHPNHDIARRQQHGFGGMVSFSLRGGLAAANRFMLAVKVFTMAESLGGVESLVEHPVSMSHSSMDAAARKKADIQENLLRLSVGLEDADDLIDDLDQGLS